jgi:hypothetical protein
MGLGIKALIIVIVLVAVAAAAHAVVSSYNTALEDAVENKNLAVKTAAERDGWIDVVAEQDAAKRRVEAALEQKEKARARLQEDRDRARRELSELRTKPENVAWMEQPIPPDIVAWLRGPGGAKPPTPEGSRSGSPALAPGSVSGAAAGGKPERRSAPIR